MAFDLSTAKPVQDTQQPQPVPVGAPQRSDFARADAIQEDILDVGGEIAAAGTRGILAIPDIVASAPSGLAGLATLATGGSLDDAVNTIRDTPVPTVGNLVEGLTGQRPGQGNFMEPGTARDVIQAGGETVIPFAAGVAPVVGRNLAKAPQALAEFFGIGSSSAPVQGASALAENVVQQVRNPAQEARRLEAIAQDVPAPQRARELAVRQQQGDQTAVGFRLDQEGNVLRDKAQTIAQNAGIDDAIIAQVAGAGPVDRGQLRKMMTIVKRGLENKTFGDFNWPREVLGDSLYGRFQAVRALNREAGKRVGAAREQLKDLPFNADAFNEGPMSSFINALEQEGVTVSNGRLNFKGSSFEGTKNSQKFLKRLAQGLRTRDTESLHAVDRLKRFIDPIIEEAGSPSQGLSKSANRIIANLRSNTNDFIREFAPQEYSDANDLFSETIDALNRSEKLIGKNNNPSPKNFGRIARKAVSNDVKGDQVLKLLEDFNEIAVRQGQDFGDDLETQISLVQTLEKLFPSTKPASGFGAEIDKSLNAAQRVAQQGTSATVADLAVGAAKKVFGKTGKEQQQALIDALDGLIKGE